MILMKTQTSLKNRVLQDAADALISRSSEILEANALDRDAARKSGMAEGLYDRLTLTEERIRGMAEGLREIALLEDPIGSVSEMKKRPNGLIIGKMTVPLGVIGVIYEARPNVTSDAAALCLKAGSAVMAIISRQKRMDSVFFMVLSPYHNHFQWLLRRFHRFSRSDAGAVFSGNETVCPTPLPVAIAALQGDRASGRQTETTDRRFL